MNIYKAGPGNTAELVEVCESLEDIEWGYKWAQMMNSWLDLPDDWREHPGDFQGYYFCV